MFKICCFGEEDVIVYCLRIEAEKISVTGVSM